MSETWEGFTAWRSGDLLKTPIVQTIPTGLQRLFSGQLSTWASIFLQVIPTQGYGTVFMRWYNDQALTQLVTSDSWDINASTGIDVILPVRAPFAALDVSVSAAGGNMVASLYLAGVNNSVGRYFYPISEQLLDEENITLAASASATYVFPLIVHGTAYISFNPHDTLAKLSLTTARLFPGGAVLSTLARFGTPAALINVVAGLPDNLFGIVVTNTDAGASHSFDLSAVAIQTG